MNKHFPLCMCFLPHSPQSFRIIAAICMRIIPSARRVRTHTHTHTHPLQHCRHHQPGTAPKNPQPSPSTSASTRDQRHATTSTTFRCIITRPVGSTAAKAPHGVINVQHTGVLVIVRACECLVCVCVFCVRVLCVKCIRRASCWGIIISTATTTTTTNFATGAA